MLWKSLIGRWGEKPEIHANNKGIVDDSAQSWSKQQSAGADGEEILRSLTNVTVYVCILDV